MFLHRGFFMSIAATFPGFLDGVIDVTANNRTVQASPLLPSPPISAICNTDFQIFFLNISLR